MYVEDKKEGLMERYRKIKTLRKVNICKMTLKYVHRSKMPHNKITLNLKK